MKLYTKYRFDQDSIKITFLIVRVRSQNYGDYLKLLLVHAVEWIEVPDLGVLALTEADQGKE